MSDSQVFVDTNILVYAHDSDAGIRHTLAKKKVALLWLRDIPPAISVQVLQELYVNLIRKGVEVAAARQTVADYSLWNVIDNDLALLTDAFDLSERWQSSLWDSLILAAAKRSYAQTIWSEDFNTGQAYDGIIVENPLLR